MFWSRVFTIDSDIPILEHRYLCKWLHKIITNWSLTIKTSKLLCKPTFVLWSSSNWCDISKKKRKEKLLHIKSHYGNCMVPSLVWRGLIVPHTLEAWKYTLVDIIQPRLRFAFQIKLTYLATTILDMHVALMQRFEALHFDTESNVGQILETLCYHNLHVILRPTTHVMRAK